MKKTVCFLRRACAVCALILCMSASALAYDGQMADGWMTQFAAALSGIAPRHDPAQTTDPARGGEVLLEYEFGTVRAAAWPELAAQDILEIDVRTSQVTDCRGVRVGMALEDALGGAAPAALDAQLVVLGTQESGYGWSWAYVGDQGIYGVEYITYHGPEAAMKEYTLTYVISDGVITAIRMKAAEATLAQAQEGMTTAEEIAQMVQSAQLAAPNDQPILAASDLTVMGGAALGVPVSNLIAYMGEPKTVQTLPEGAGRILLYDGAAVRLALHEATGEEIVRGVSVSSAAIFGPRALCAGMSAQDATALFACEAPVSLRGGTLYLAGEALGEAPYGEAVRTEDGVMLRYTCVMESGEVAVLEVGVSGGTVAYWSMAYQDDAKDGV